MAEFNDSGDANVVLWDFIALPMLSDHAVLLTTIHLLQVQGTNRGVVVLFTN